MSDASTIITFSTDANDRSFVASGRFGVYESRGVSIELSNGSAFPAGAYTFALSFAGRAVALCGLTLAAGKLTGTLNLATDELSEIFLAVGSAARRIVCQATVWDNTGRVVWARGRCDVWRTDYTTTAVSPTALTATYYSGKATIAEGDSSATVSLSAYSLSAAPASAFVSVQSANGDVIAATVTTLTATQLVATMTAPASAGGCTLHWLVFPSA